MIAARMPSLTSPYGLHLPARQHLSSLRSRRAFVGYMHASFMDACIRWLSDGSRYACLSMNGYYGPITNTVLLLPSQQSQNDLSPAQHGRRDSTSQQRIRLGAYSLQIARPSHKNSRLSSSEIRSQRAQLRTWKSHGIVWTLGKALFQPFVAGSHIITSWTNAQENDNGCQHAMYDPLRLLATALRPLVWHCTITIMPTARVISQMFAYESLFTVSTNPCSFLSLEVPVC
jgi:hypothetical protein